MFSFKNLKPDLLLLFLRTPFKMIDLSFLTEEEQETIMEVLQRDAALKRVEEERVRYGPGGPWCGGGRASL